MDHQKGLGDGGAFLLAQIVRVLSPALGSTDFFITTRDLGANGLLDWPLDLAIATINSVIAVRLVGRIYGPLRPLIKGDLALHFPQAEANLPEMLRDLCHGERSPRA